MVCGVCFGARKNDLISLPYCFGDSFEEGACGKTEEADEEEEEEEEGGAEGRKDFRTKYEGRDFVCYELGQRGRGFGRGVVCVSR